MSGFGIGRVAGEIQEEEPGKPSRGQGRIDQQRPSQRERGLREGVEENQEDEAARADAREVFRDPAPADGGEEKQNEERSDGQHQEPPGPGSARTGLGYPPIRLPQ